jgi:intracellular septation protein A
VIGTVGDEPEPDVVIEVGNLRPMLLRAGRLFIETVLVPTGLFYLLLHTAGLVAGLVGVISWSVVVVAGRWIFGRRLPGTLLVCAGVLCGRACVALLLTSAVVYLMQPVVGSVLMAMLFLGSAAIGRPVTVRLARDFIELPAQLFHRHGVRRMFAQVAVVWGGSRLLDAGMSVVFLHWGIDAGLLSRGVFSGVLTALTILGCGYWGWRSLRRLPGITLRWSHPPRLRTE